MNEEPELNVREVGRIPGLKVPLGERVNPGDGSEGDRSEAFLARASSFAVPDDVAASVGRVVSPRRGIERREGLFEGKKGLVAKPVEHPEEVERREQAAARAEEIAKRTARKLKRATARRRARQGREEQRQELMDALEGEA